MTSKRKQANRGHISGPNKLAEANKEAFLKAGERAAAYRQEQSVSEPDAEALIARQEALQNLAQRLDPLQQRARDAGVEQGPLVPIEPVLSVDEEQWTWETIDEQTLGSSSHRLVLQKEDGTKRELFRTDDIAAAMQAASRVAEFQGGVVLIETLEP